MTTTLKITMTTTTTMALPNQTHSNFEISTMTTMAHTDINIIKTTTSTTRMRTIKNVNVVFDF